MEDEAFKKFIEVEYPKAIGFYDHRANSSKRWYRGLSTYLLCASAIMSTLIAFAPDGTCSKIFTSLISASIVIASGLLGHLKCHENWLSFRGSWDALERERRYFETGTGEYEGVTDKRSLFVKRVEQIRSREATDFYSRHAKGEEQQKPPENLSSQSGRS